MTSHQWKYSTIKLNGAAHALLDCEKDDYYSWSANGIYTHTPGLVLCSGNQKVGSESYSLSYDMKTIIYPGPVGANEEKRYNIVELTANKLVTSFTAGDGVFEDTYIPY